MYQDKKSKPMNSEVFKLYYFLLPFADFYFLFFPETPALSDESKPNDINDSGIILVINNPTLRDLRVLHGNITFQLPVLRVETTYPKWAVIDTCACLNSADTMINVTSCM